MLHKEYQVDRKYTSRHGETLKNIQEKIHESHLVAYILFIFSHDIHIRNASGYPHINVIKVNNVVSSIGRSLTIYGYVWGAGVAPVPKAPGTAAKSYDLHLTSSYKTQTS